MTRWLPRGFRINEGVTAGKELSSDIDWQLYSTSDNGFAVAVSLQLYEKWSILNILPEGLFVDAETSEGKYAIAYDNHENRIASVKYGPYPENYEDAIAFALALKNSREAIPDISFDDSLYFEKYSLILPTYREGDSDDQRVLCRWLASGVEISLDKFDRLCEIVSWLSPSALTSVIRAAGFSVSTGSALEIENKRQKETSEVRTAPENRRDLQHEIGEHFSLPGRPVLEAFFNEHIVDIIRNSDKYKRMGIGFPSAVILYGPPGCGKTFAVEKLTDFLGWPSFYIDSGTIGSPFIHDTSKKISEVFDRAIEDAPSVMIIDEMEAFLSDRNMSQGMGQHHVEEVAEFLRRIPEANSKNVLVIAMTNLIDSIDPAILRRGRFDHIVEVQMPSKEEVFSLLHHLLKDLPVSDDIDYEAIATKLKGHAMSDVTFVIKEAGRLAVKEDKDCINNGLIDKAIDLLPKKKESTRKIGF